MQYENYATPSNYKNERYEAVYEKKLHFEGNSKEVTALVYDYKDEYINDFRLYVYFVFDGKYVTMCGAPEIFTEEFWNTFSMS